MKRILLIDDDPLTREFIRRGLASQGVEVDVFDSATEALGAAATESVDLVVSDVSMPSMTGLELARRLRARGCVTPIILVTADPTPELERDAAAAGVVRVLRKRADLLDELTTAVWREICKSDAQNVVRNLDELRHAFLTDLSHQLRTPVTAMKLALEGLFDDLRPGGNPARDKLAGIGRRNVQRIVGLVENQLDLLDLMLGDARVARRLVDLRVLVSHAVEHFRRPEYGAGTISFDASGLNESSGEAAWGFTDPEHLRKVIDCVLGLGAQGAPRSVKIRFDNAQQCYELTIELAFLNGAHCAGAEKAASAGQACDNGPAADGATDFETRAYQSILWRLGGRAVVRKNADHKYVHIAVPVCPSFDRAKDFLNPLRALRAAASDQYSGVVLLKCEPADPSAGRPSIRELADFFSRIRSVVGNGDAVLRGRERGTVYVALEGRSGEEIEHVRAFLASSDTASNSRATYVYRPQTVLADRTQIDELVPDLEPV